MGCPYVGSFTAAVRHRGGYYNPTFPRRNFKGFVDIFLNDQSFSMMIFHEIVLPSLPTLYPFLSHLAPAQGEKNDVNSFVRNLMIHKNFTPFFLRTYLYNNLFIGLKIGKVKK